MSVLYTDAKIQAILAEPKPLSGRLSEAVGAEAEVGSQGARA